ncbi:hypothetical protein GH733_015907 [Mirounga leonina]|nr:hypothetical protein GH733_015907 [Mirounga leonina]
MGGRVPGWPGHGPFSWWRPCRPGEGRRSLVYSREIGHSQHSAPAQGALRWEQTQVSGAATPVPALPPGDAEHTPALALQDFQTSVGSAQQLGASQPTVASTDVAVGLGATVMCSLTGTPASPPPVFAAAGQQDVSTRPRRRFRLCPPNLLPLSLVPQPCPPTSIPQPCPPALSPSLVPPSLHPPALSPSLRPPASSPQPPGLSFCPSAAHPQLRGINPSGLEGAGSRPALTDFSALLMVPDLKVTSEPVLCPPLYCALFPDASPSTQVGSQGGGTVRGASELDVEMFCQGNTCIVYKANKDNRRHLPLLIDSPETAPPASLSFLCVQLRSLQ